MVIKSFLQVHILNLLFFVASARTNTLYPGQSISNDQTLISENGVFVLRLNTLHKESQICYSIAIWFNRLPVQTIAWGVQTYRHECGDYRHLLTVSMQGKLVLREYYYHSNESTVIWSSKSSSGYNKTRLVLEDNGNLVIRNILNASSILWQSFDHQKNVPWLPGAKVRFDKSQGYLPAEGPNFSVEIDPETMSSIVLKKNGTKYGDCKLKGISFSCSLNLGWYTGEADILLHEHTNVTYVSNENETYFIYTMTNSVLSQFTIDSNGLFTQLIWSRECNLWMPSKVRLSDAYCDQFAVYSQGRNYDCPHSYTTEQKCARQSVIRCHGGEKQGFLLIHDAVFLDANASTEGSPKRCKLACLHDDSCQAYSYYTDNVCLMTHHSSSQFVYQPGSRLYYRIGTTKARRTKRRFSGPILGAIIGGPILIITFIGLIWKCRRRNVPHESSVVEGTSSLVHMKYGELCRATKNFSCKLGEGGCGSVFKGKWSDSTEPIAVKHLKVHCREEKQFRAEVSTVGLIHHVNLVRLVGFCAKGTKRFLIYEYIPHGSLNKHIFGDDHGILDWRTRYQIGLGIAKGLAYLHSECRDCIIHCDIKPENILLDDEFNPKIADFGLAKLVGRDFSRVLTTMRGTIGYLAPEWISGLAITSKADVYSFGMMLFEIISGKRNCSIINGKYDYIPLRVMQTLLSEGQVKSLLDSKLEGNAKLEEVIRLCRVAGWCIQENEEDRPSMVQVIRILEGTLEVINPPIPRFLQYIADNPDEYTMYHSCIDLC